jgi:uncharacterized protein involved in exopolysaccharide biosynthesis
MGEEIMTEAQARVAEAQAQLKSANTELAAEAKEVLRKQLAEVRAQIRTAKATYADLRKQIRNGEQSVARIQAQIDELVGQITASWQERPEATDYLPDDPEVAAWQAQHASLEQQKDRAIARRTSTQTTIPPLVEAAKYEGNFGIIATLERSENNLIRRIKGEPIGQSWQGGVYRVL